MDDICMCKGEGCPIKDKCLRHTNQSSDPIQSWFSVSPYDHEKGECGYFWDNTPKKTGRRR